MKHVVFPSHPYIHEQSIDMCSGEPFRFDVILTSTSDGGIAMKGELPVHNPEDLRRFKRITMGGAVIMGSRTWISIKRKNRPLVGRINIVLTRMDIEKARRKYDIPEDVVVVNFIKDALEYARVHVRLAKSEHRCFVIGGASLFNCVFSQPQWRSRIDIVHWTPFEVAGKPSRFVCDQFVTLPTWLTHGTLDKELVTAEGSLVRFGFMTQRVPRSMHARKPTKQRNSCHTWSSIAAFVLIALALFGLMSVNSMCKSEIFRHMEP